MDEAGDESTMNPLEAMNDELRNEAARDTARGDERARRGEIAGGRGSASRFTTAVLMRERRRRSARRADAAIVAIGSAVGGHLPQADLASWVGEFCCETDGQRSFLSRIFLRAGNEQRSCVMAGPGDDPMAELRAFYPPRSEQNPRGPTTGARMQRYAIEAPKLARRAAEQALQRAELLGRQITHLITVSCTGFFAPGLDCALIESLGLRSDVSRVHVGFMGCHAAFNALAVARDMALADPAAVVLVCCVELCSLHFASGWSPEAIVANSLFGDGAAAAIVTQRGWVQPTAAGNSAAGSPWRIRRLASLLLPDCRGAMTWRIGDHGFEMTLAAEVPAIVKKNLQPWTAAWLGEAKLSADEIDQWAVHPGGPKVISAVESSLGLAAQKLATSRKLLAEHGNLSSGSVLQIIQNLPENAGGTCAALGFGPGLMAEGMLLGR